MKFEAHCAASSRLFGESFEQVHQWLDEYFSTPLGAKHRRKRHHLAGIELVRQRWGDKAAEAARQHIIDDLKDEGWVEGRDRIPLDEADYARLGLF
jgi:DNA-binding FadR family transcriptional regulator